ncbi:MAG: hypothetical protein ABSB79_08520 [Syntrophales bacterium]
MSYYSTISEKSRKISLSLESATRDQLSAFNSLFKYEGLSIRAAIILELAFDDISPESEDRVKHILISNLRELWDFGLFVLSDKTLTLDDLERMTEPVWENWTVT